MAYRKRGFSGTLDPNPTEREQAHRRLARQAAAESMVLLKNDGVLPLAPGSCAALYGMGARYTIAGGTGSGSVNSREILDALEAKKDLFLKEEDLDKCILRVLQTILASDACE